MQLISFGTMPAVAPVRMGRDPITWHQKLDASMAMLMADYELDQADKTVAVFLKLTKPLPADVEQDLLKRANSKLVERGGGLLWTAEVALSKVRALAEREEIRYIGASQRLQPN